MTISRQSAVKHNQTEAEAARPTQATHLDRARSAQTRILIEDYVELIADLAADGTPVGPSELARHLGVSHATVIKCIARIGREGLATTVPYHGVSLTDSGTAMAARVRERHRVVVSLLRAVGVPREEAEADAEGIEHHVSPTTLAAFQRFLDPAAGVLPVAQAPPPVAGTHATGTISQLDAAAAAAAGPDLAAILRRCVDAGASVGFLRPLAKEAAAAYWQHLLPDIEAGRLLLFVATLGDRIVGTVQLVPCFKPNGRHRAEIAKLLVDPHDRRIGVARRLMQAAETEARRRGLDLLVLDTRQGDPAENLYRDLGFSSVGLIPGYVKDERGTAQATHMLFKSLA